MNYTLYAVLSIVGITIIFAIIMVLLSAPTAWLAKVLRNILSKRSESMAVISDTVLEYIPKAIGIIVAGCTFIFMRQFTAIIYVVQDDCNWSKNVYWSGVKNLSDDPARPCLTTIERGYIYVYNEGEKPYIISYPNDAIVPSHKVYIQEIVDEDDADYFESKQLDKTFQQSLFDSLFE